MFPAFLFCIFAIAYCVITVIERPQNKNLKPFKKGDDPRRCKRGKQKLPDLYELLEELGGEGIREVIKALHTQAKKGNVKAIQELLDRYYGKSQQSIDLSTKGESLNKKVDLSKLTEEELREYAALQSKLEGN